MPDTHTGSGRSRKAAAVAIGMLLWCGGCGLADPNAAGGSSARARKLVEDTVSLVEREKPSYRVQTELVSGGVTAPSLKQSAAGAGTLGTDGSEPELQEVLGLLKKADYQASLQEERGTPGETVVTAKVAGEAWTDWNRRMWQERLQTMQSGAEALIAQESAKYTGAQAERLRTQMTASLETAKSRMSGMIGSLNSSGTCTFRFKRMDGKPYSVVVENRLNYSSEGRSREEIIRTTYHIGTAGNGADLP